MPSPSCTPACTLRFPHAHPLAHLGSPATFWQCWNENCINQSEMTKATLIKTDQFPYHVMSRTTRKAFFELPMSKVYEIISIWINLTSYIYGTKTHHFMLMNNHFHWILTTPNRNIDLAMCFMLSNVAKHVNDELGQNGQLWGGRYRYSILKSESAYYTVAKYVYRNPVRAGIANKVEHYPFSTLQYLYGIGKSGINVFEDHISVSTSYDHKFLEWLNAPFFTEELDQIANSLQRPEFKFRRSTRSKRFEIKEPWVPKGSRGT